MPNLLESLAGRPRSETKLLNFMLIAQATSIVEEYRGELSSTTEKVVRTYLKEVKNMEQPVDKAAQTIFNNNLKFESVMCVVSSLCVDKEQRCIAVQYHYAEVIWAGVILR